MNSDKRTNKTNGIQRANNKYGQNIWVGELITDKSLGWLIGSKDYSIIVGVVKGDYVIRKKMSL